MKPTLVIMAAGLGSRYGGLKQLEPVGLHGEILMEFAIYDAIKAGFGDVIFVIKHEMEADVRKLVGDRLSQYIPVSYAYQRMDNIPKGFSVPEGRVKPWGTGHAVLSVLPLIKNPFCVINADDFYGYAAFEQVCQFLKQSTNETPYACCMAGFPIENTLTAHGTVARGVCEIDAQNRLTTIIERTKIEESDAGIRDMQTSVHIPYGTLVSMNFWGFPVAILSEFEQAFATFLETTPNLDKSEFFLPFVVDALLQEGKATVDVLPTNTRWYGMTYKEDRDLLAESLRKLRADGQYPDSLWDLY